MKCIYAIAIAASALFALCSATDESSGVVVARQEANAQNATNGGRFDVNAVASSACMGGQNIDLTGGDFMSTQGGPETCCNQCRRYAACASYSWTNYQGGTCWLKNTVGSVNVYIGGKSCVIAPEGITGTYAQYAQFSNCDMPGNDLAHTQVNAEDFAGCEFFCWKNPQCKAVTWTNFEGGTCWFKGAVTKCTKYTGARTSVPFSEIN